MTHFLTRRFSVRHLAGAAALAGLLASGALQAAETTKDIVLDRAVAPVAAAATGTAVVALPSQDVLAVSVLLESADGALAPKSPATTLFATGDRFRVKLLAGRNGRVSLFNTNPAGQFNPTPVWQGQVRVGEETISPRLRLDGRSGVDYLHVVLEPEQPPQGLIGWLTQWLGREGAQAPKDIRLDSESSGSTAYMVNQSGQGLVTSIRIVHR